MRGTHRCALPRSQPILSLLRSHLRGIGADSGGDPPGLGGGGESWEGGVMASSRGSPNLEQVAEHNGRLPGTAKDRVFAHLNAHPEDARSPSKVAANLQVNGGTAKRLLKEYRDSRKPGIASLLGPTLLQNVRIVCRTYPGTTWLGSPTPSSLAKPFDRGDGKSTVKIPLPPEGHVEIALSPNGTLEVILAAPRGLTPGEALIILALLGFPVTENEILVTENEIASIIDSNAPVTLAIEVLRDGASMRFEGVDARTYHDVEGVLLKMYDHTDARGTLGRIEVRAPKMKLSFAEIDAFLAGKQPLGRDTKI